MSKLYKLREWLTLPEAAKKLSISFGEDVTEAAVLRLALDGHLRLSVYFVNHAMARCGEVVSWDETDWWLMPKFESFPGESIGRRRDEKKVVEAKEHPRKLRALYDDLLPDERKKLIPVMRSLNIDDERFVTLSDDVTTLRGVWDLPMIGAEQLDVEHLFQQLTDGPAVTLLNLEGAFVEGSRGELCQLQEDLEENEFQAGSRAQLAKLQQHILEEDLGRKKTDALLKKHEESRKTFLEKRQGSTDSENYYPAAGLPQDAVLVVRTNAIRELEEAFSDKEGEQAKALAPRAETTYLNIIGAMLSLMLGRTPSGRPRSVFDNQSAIVSALLADHEGKQGISKRTLEDKFAEANRSLNSN